jgi:protein-tyrosine phosphatase
MMTRVFWVPEAAPHRLAFMPRPHGGEDLQYEVQGWQAEEIDTVVSLLEHAEARYLGLEEEALQCEKAGIEFLSFPIGDRGLPGDFHQTDAFVQSLADRLRQGKSVSVHCRVGIGRSSLIAGCVLLHLGLPFADIFPALKRARGVDVPDTAEQLNWVREYGIRRT